MNTETKQSPLLTTVRWISFLPCAALVLAIATLIMQVFIWITNLAARYILPYVTDYDGPSPLVDFLFMCVPGFISVMAARAMVPSGKNIAAVIWLGVLIVLLVKGYQIDPSQKLKISSIAMLLGVLFANIQAFRGKLEDFD